MIITFPDTLDKYVFSLVKDLDERHSVIKDELFQYNLPLSKI